MNEYKKPPLGLRPRFIWESQRITEIEEAMIRYYEAGIQPPLEWAEELSEHILNKTTRELDFANGNRRGNQ
jgi:hypothetical protein